MLAAAMNRASAQFQARLTARVPGDASAEAALRAVADELLGLGPERREASVLWLARLARASVDNEAARMHARDWQEIEDVLARLLAAVRREHGPGRNSDDAAALLALLDGLAMAALTERGRMPPERAERILAAALERLLRDG